MSAALSDRFPTRSEIARAAQVEAMISTMRARNQPVPPGLVREAQHALATFNQLAPFEQDLVRRQFNADVAHVVESVHVEVETRQQDALRTKTDNLVRELTQGMAGRPGGLTLELAAALRAGDKVKVRTRKLPTGAEADARVQAHTGMDLKTYEKKLDDALVERNRKFYDDPAAYQRYIARQFPGQDFRAVDRVVRTWAVEGAGLELQRRAQKDVPDTRTVRPLDASEQRRLAVIEAVAEHEAGDPRSPFHKDQTDRLREIAAERHGDNDLRSDLAEAFLAHGGTFDVEVGPTRDDASDEIVSIEEDDDNG